ncbi:MAG: hypothetical protein JWQ79_2884 [Mucilaginibacter sp.]|nr:hypothetical protein [Mucilaginibacter sp.]
MEKIIVHIRLVFILTVISLFTIKPACAQILTDIQQNLEHYRQNALHEKLYVHTDKSFYLTGEILWFKIYAVNAANNQPLNLSKVAYVDVIDNDHNTVMQTKVELKNAMGNGSVYIPVSVNNGNYKLRVYTNWMKNFSPDYYFEKTITIINPLKTPLAVEDTSSVYDVQLFPEGGNLVKNLQSKVAFKVTGNNGKGVDFRGAIINQRNDTIVKFNPLKFGMGNFMFTPVAGNTYRAVVSIANTRPVIKPLPAVNDEGYVLQVSPQNGSYTIVVKGSPVNQSSTVYLLVHTKQLTKIAEAKPLQNGVANFTIDNAKLDDGISSITIFNSNKQPVCERLIFKYPSKKLVIAATTDQARYNTRKKVSVNLSAKDQDQKQVSGNLSVAVYKVDSLQTVDDNDILSYLWLRSDLRGNIESPGYYLKTNDATAALALDNLLLTQGWRRFKWNDVLNNTTSNYKFLPEYNGHLISGRLKRNSANINQSGIVGYLSIPGKNIQLYTAKSDSAGKFLFNAKLFYGPNELVAQTDFTKVDTTYRIEVESPFSSNYSTAPLPPADIKEEAKATLQAQSVAMQVQNLYANEKTNRFFEPVIDSSAFYGTPDKSYLLDTYTRFPTMEEVLKEYVTWVLTTRSRGKYQIRMYNEDNFVKEGPLVLLDGVPVFDIDKTYSIDPLKVRKLDVIHNRYFYGPAVAEGILSFTTYKGNMGGFEIDPKAVIIDYEGMSLRREFYSPVYETQTQINSRLPDFRNLLYWAPNVTTPIQGSNNLTFYTSDQQGKYIGVIQGITADGNAGSQYFTFEVKK